MLRLKGSLFLHLDGLQFRKLRLRMSERQSNIYNFYPFFSSKFPSGLMTPSIYDFCILHNLMNSSDLCAKLKLQELKCVHN